MLQRKKQAFLAQAGQRQQPEPAPEPTPAPDEYNGEELGYDPATHVINPATGNPVTIAWAQRMGIVP